MKNTKRAAELLAELRTLAENDFERHRIDVLEKDLTDPPKVEIIDDKHQKFDGINFGTKQYNHFYRCLSLHRFVYNYCYGEIPEGYEIHHKDLNPCNNDISNLQMLTKEEHTRLHKNHIINKTCAFCGSTFKTNLRNLKFCSDKCRNAYYRKKYTVPAKCEYCGKDFQSQKHEGTRFCSRSCAMKYVREKYNKSIIRTAPANETPLN